MTEQEYNAYKRMDENQWLRCAEPWRMLIFLDQGNRKRKFRLFAVACLRRHWESIVNPLSRWAVDVAEQWADRTCTGKELRRAISFANEDFDQQLRNGVPSGGIAHAVVASLFRQHHTAANTVSNTLSGMSRDPDGEWKMQADLLREIFGNPFRPVAIDPAWLTWHDGIIVKIAQRIYEERAFADLPILADALEEAGCATAELLAHCRSAGPHVRGCWAVDLLLGKT